MCVCVGGGGGGGSISETERLLACSALILEEEEVEILVVVERFDDQYEQPPAVYNYEDIMHWFNFDNVWLVSEINGLLWQLKPHHAHAVQ